MTTALFLLRCTEIGISIADLDLLTIGLVMDMWTEKGNDGATYDKSHRRRILTGSNGGSVHNSVL